MKKILKFIERFDEINEGVSEPCGRNLKIFDFQWRQPHQLTQQSINHQFKSKKFDLIGLLLELLNDCWWNEQRPPHLFLAAHGVECRRWKKRMNEFIKKDKLKVLFYEIDEM